MMSGLKVRDLMTEQVFCVTPDDDLATLRDLMMERHVRHIPVVDADRDLVGIVSHRDLLRSSLIEQPDLPGYLQESVLTRLAVRDVMTEDVATVEADTDLRDAAELMFENKYGCLPVTEGTRLAGILTESDFVRFMAHGN